MYGDVYDYVMCICMDRYMRMVMFMLCVQSYVCVRMCCVVLGMLCICVWLCVCGCVVMMYWMMLCR